jgi:hypothetical protein
VKAYLKLCQTNAHRALAEVPESVRVQAEIRGYLDYVELFADQVRRRILDGETIPHEEKVFSVHEPHARWINKGKAGVLAELGLPVCFLEDQHQFILHHAVLHEGVDSDMIVRFMEAEKALYPTIVSCSMDKGYHSQRNRTELDRLLDLNVLPKKGRWSKADRERETAPAFVAARRLHPGVESAIKNLNHRGLDQFWTHSEKGFVRTVALGVVVANVHRLGQIVKKQEQQYERWHRARRPKSGVKNPHPHGCGQNKESRATKQGRGVFFG